jgi:predicted lipase
MNINQAIRYAQLVNAAYAIDPANLTNSAGTTVSTDSSTHEVVTTIYANDLATDMHPENGNKRVSIGLILQASGSGDVVIAIRGTEGIHEWIHDAQFLPTPCPFMPAAGNIEDGFTDMYSSLRVGVDALAPSLVQALPKLPFKRAVTSVTVCGHSLGGALATFLALDIATNAINFNFIPTVYTYASPRTGDSQFVNLYNHVVPNTFRIANRVDLVPKLPLPPLYEHVLGLFDLSSITVVPPKVLVKPEIPCLHILTTYLYLLSLQAGGTPLPLNQGCTI